MYAIWSMVSAHTAHRSRWRGGVQHLASPHPTIPTYRKAGRRGGRDRARARAPAPSTRAAATSSLAVLLVELFISRVLPWSSFLTIAADNEAAISARDDSSQASGPSAAIRRSARISSPASLHLAILGVIRVPFTASWSSGSRKRSHRIASGDPQAATAAR